MKKACILSNARYDENGKRLDTKTKGKRKVKKIVELSNKHYSSLVKAPNGIFISLRMAFNGHYYLDSKMKKKIKGELFDKKKKREKMEKLGSSKKEFSEKQKDDKKQKENSKEYNNK